MPIRIEEVNAKGLGPLKEFSGTLSDVNLIYGHNEQGKTFLVEFLLNSLFKDIKGFGLRSTSASGTVLVSGLGEGIQKFSPNSRKKLEKYLETSHQGMPANIARLLVVKGAELEFDKDIPGGISKTIIRSFLSGEDTFDFILDNIKKTIQKTEIVNNRIVGPKRAEIQDRTDLLNRLTALDCLLREVDQTFSGGTRSALKHKVAHHMEIVNAQIAAKRHKAYCLSNDLASIEKDVQQYQDNGLDALIANCDARLRNKAKLVEKEKNLVEAKANSEHYEWLETAIAEYENHLQRGGLLVKRTNLILSFVATIIGILFTSIGIALPQFMESVYGLLPGILGMGMIIFGGFFGYLYIRQHQRQHNALAESDELERIAATFKKKFGESTNDLATLKNKYKYIQRAYFKSQDLEEEIKIVYRDVDRLEDEINLSFSNFEIEISDPTTWNKKANQLKDSFDDFQVQVQELKLSLAELDVKHEEYLASDPGANFSKFELANGKEQLIIIEKLLIEEEDGLKILDREIRVTINDQKSETLDELLENLRKNRIEVIEEYKQITSRILAGVLLTKVIEDAREQEDEKIKANLESGNVREPLYTITNRYEAVTFDGESIKVQDKFDEFDIADLSTGAQEQVLLALRIGFASRAMGQDTAFLILDDAFQHSDWVRRERLVKETMELAKRGWQILYFTMDNHIEYLFDRHGKAKLKKKYKKFILVTE
ncbi:MAG: hypothetical protein QGM50_11455 [Anaerolineae bacterium]|nr:hypothetical protein [Anaerolineae bacterium]